MAAFLVLVSVCLAWWYAWRMTRKIAKQREWENLTRYFFCTVNACIATFAVFCITGGLLLPDPENSGHIVASLGAFILVPLAIYLHRANRPVLHQSVGTSNQISTSAVAHKLDVNDATATETAGITLPHGFTFKYADHQGQITARRVRVMGIASNDGRQYLDGYCLDRNAMRTFRVDRIQGDLTDPETGELFNVYSLLAATAQRRHMDYTPAKAEFSLDEADEVFDDEELPTTVLFTGFTKARKAELEVAAEAAGWVVRSTVSKSLDYLVCGPKAGIAKIEKSKELGVLVIDENSFEKICL